MYEQDFSEYLDVDCCGQPQLEEKNTLITLKKNYW